jgi:hypothetical protein
VSEALHSCTNVAASVLVFVQSKNQNVVDMEKYLDQRIRVKFQGGREGE